MKKQIGRMLIKVQSATIFYLTALKRLMMSWFSLLNNFYPNESFEFYCLEAKYSFDSNVKFE